MRRIENECVDCELPCMGSHCPYRNVLHYYCDGCNDEFNLEELCEYEGDELCKDCLFKLFPKVKEDILI